MTKMSLGEFKEHYSEHSAIAALAVIVEDEANDKKRIIHDATHGVRVNHRIKCNDKLCSPGAREKKHLLREHQEEGSAPSASGATGSTDPPPPDEPHEESERDDSSSSRLPDTRAPRARTPGSSPPRAPESEEGMVAPSHRTETAAALQDWASGLVHGRLSKLCL